MLPDFNESLLRAKWTAKVASECLLSAAFGVVFRREIFFRKRFLFLSHRRKLHKEPYARFTTEELVKVLFLLFVRCDSQSDSH